MTEPKTSARPEPPPELKRILDALEVQMSRMGYNSARVERLIRIYKRSAPETDGDASDVLRACVVLLHASLEDYLRAVATTYLPYTSTEVLNEIPLAGQLRERPEKFLLGSLSSFRGQTIDQVIEQSVWSYLDRRSFNNCREVAWLVESVGVEIASVNGFFPELDALMSRRHLIVHRADLLEYAVRDIRVNAITAEEVERWAKNANEFARLLTKTISANEIEALLERRRIRRLDEAARTDGGTSTLPP